jgi:putative FmdB family regulatory protein
MPTYSYECHKHGEFEAEHPITTQLEECPKCKEEGNPPHPPKRLISGGTGFILAGNCWAKDSYSK